LVARVADEGRRRIHGRRLQGWGNEPFALRDCKLIKTGVEYGLLLFHGR